MIAQESVRGPQAHPSIRPSGYSGELSGALEHGRLFLGYFLLNLHLATGEKKYLRAAVGAGLRLVKTAKTLPGGGLQWAGTYERKGRWSFYASAVQAFTERATELEQRLDALIHRRRRFTDPDNARFAKRLRNLA